MRHVLIFCAFKARSSLDMTCTYDPIPSPAMAGLLTSGRGVIAEVVASDSFIDLFLETDADARSGTVVALFTAGCE